MARSMTGQQYAASKYNEYQVNQPMLLMDFLRKQLDGISENKL